jgi:hypothetical protein
MIEITRKEAKLWLLGHSSPSIITRLSWDQIFEP